MRTVMMRTVTLGKYQVNVSEKSERVPKVVVRKLGRILRRVSELTSSLLVRVDMAPWYFDTKVPPIYEVETAPGGVWMFGLFQQEHVLFRLASSLSIGYAVCSDPNWKEAYDLLAPYFRVVDSPFDCGEKGRIYWSALPDEITLLPGSFRSFVVTRLITDPLASKKQLLSALGLILSESETQDLISLLSGSSSMKTDVLCEILKDYYLNLNGVVVKPDYGWGSKGIVIFPFDSQLRKQVSGCSTITKLTNTLSNFDNHVVQPFFKPREEVIDGKTYFIIWRLFFFRRNREEEDWRYLGGIWNARRSLLVHGASDAVFGPVVVD